MRRTGRPEDQYLAVSKGPRKKLYNEDVPVYTLIDDDVHYDRGSNKAEWFEIGASLTIGSTDPSSLRYGAAIYASSNEPIDKNTQELTDVSLWKTDEIFHIPERIQYFLLQATKLQQSTGKWG